MSHMTVKAQPKPRKGAAAKAKRARRARIERTEHNAKLAAKERDGWTCRRCGYPHQRGHVLWCSAVEAAHIFSSGMGGRPSVGNDPKFYVTLCADCHRGPRGQHAGYFTIVPKSLDLLGNGAVDFPANDKIGGTAHGVDAPVPPLSTRRG